MSAMKITPVIMSGGTGSRLWPQSRAQYPKQYLHLVNESSMLQNTLLRLKGIKESNLPLVIANEEHRFIAAEQTRQQGMQCQAIILEPVGRNTAPAVAVAAFEALKSNEDVLLLVLAADHTIENINAFHNAVEKAKKNAEQGKLVTFGIVASHPETGYGYIKANKKGGLVEQFVEKPNYETAKEYIASGDYFWNSGMFMFSAKRYLEELKVFQPEIYAASKASIDNSSIDMDFVRLNKKQFASCPNISIDYAIMEKTADAIMVPLDAGWSDVGSWSSLWDLGEKDEKGNAIIGDVITTNSNNCYIRAEQKLIATIGVDNLVITESDDAILVAHKESVQDVKKIVEELKSKDRKEAKLHRKVYRPWGCYDSIDNGKRFQVKRITVNPGQKLSVQMHHHRAEHWIVVSGTAKVTLGSKELLITENQSTYIPIGEIHALENPGKIPLHLIEVQTGSYLGEDDIIRFNDRYGRS
ncbi:mannose-1-phosphate guanylyltransferase/mannose-6-phosphate isomerase [Endozoicomonadaceae bacterium StTr2]